MKWAAQGKRLPPNGFTLVEVAIVIVVISLLLGGMLYPLSQQRFDYKNAQTRTQLGEIKEALYGYAIQNRRLPCPDRTAGAGSNDGIADACAGPANAEGNLPWATLGLRSGDDWGGNRFRYRVATAVTQVPVLPATNHCAPAFTPGNDLRVFSTCTPTCLTANQLHAPRTLAAVVLSHGKNGRGAMNSGNLFNPLPITVDELENRDVDDVFVDRRPTTDTRAPGQFDDLVDYLPVTLLCSRMVQAGF